MKSAGISLPAISSAYRHDQPVTPLTFLSVILKVASEVRLQLEHPTGRQTVSSSPISEHQLWTAELVGVVADFDLANQPLETMLPSNSSALPLVIFVVWSPAIFSALVDPIELAG